MNLMQVITNSLITSAEIGLIAVGLSLTFAILKFANFAHVEAAVTGAYIAYLFNVTLGLNLALSMAMSVLIMGFVGCVFYRLVFSKVVETDDVTPMVVSLGLAIALRHGLQAIWGPQHVVYDYEIMPGNIVFGAFITFPQIGILISAVTAMLAFHLLLRHTRIGKAMRATAANMELAQACSIDTGKVILLVWFLGTAFAALGGILIGWDTQIDPYLGFNLVIPVFCAVLIGGIGSVHGAILGSLIVGFAQNFGIALNFAPWIGLFGLFEVPEDISLPAAYKPAITYAAVILLLIIRPTGITRRETS